MRLRTRTLTLVTAIIQRTTHIPYAHMPSTPQEGLSKDQQMLKTVWQWRYQSLFLQKSTQIQHQQRSARRMTCTILCITTRQRLGWGFEKLKERLFMGRIQLTATIFKKKTAKLTKTGLRLNAKYKLERMGRLLDRGWCRKEGASTVCSLVIDPIY